MPVKVKVKIAQLCPTLCNCKVHGILQARISVVGSLWLLQGIFLTQGSNPGLPCCRRILYQLSRSPRILEWVAYPVSSRPSQPRNQTRVSRIAGGSFTNWANREAQMPVRPAITTSRKKPYIWPCGTEHPWFLTGQLSDHNQTAVSIFSFHLKTEDWVEMNLRTLSLYSWGN